MSVSKEYETSGVYIFYAENGDCLYVGSSINMRRRVMNHNLRKIIDMDRVEYIPCPISQLRDKEEEIVFAKRPKLNSANSISRPGEPTPNTTKLSFAFEPEDMEAISKIKAKMSVTQGKVSSIAAIRFAIRAALQRPE